MITYDRQSVASLKSQYQGQLPTFGFIDYVSNMPEDVQNDWQGRINALYTRLYNDGVVDQAWLEAALSFSAYGAFIFPTLPSTNLPQEAYYAQHDLLLRHGILQLKNEILTKGTSILQDQAEQVEQEIKYYDASYDAARYISGAALLDEFNSWIAKVQDEVQKGRDLMSLAQQNLPDEDYQQVRANLLQINGELDKIEIISPGAMQSAFGGGLGLAPIIIAGIVVAAAVGVVAIVYLTIKGMNLASQALYLSLIEKDKNAKMDAATQAKDAQIASVDALVTAGQIDPVTAAAQKAAILAQWQAAIDKAAAEADAARKTVPDSSAGTEGMVKWIVGAVAIIAAVILVPKILEYKRSTAAAPKLAK